MSRFFSRRSRPIPRGPLPSPRYFLEWAVMLAVLFLVVHLAGLRNFTSVLNGTIGSTSLDWNTAAFLGTGYVLVYLAFVLGVPILLLAALILKVWQKVAAKKGTIESATKTTSE